MTARPHLTVWVDQIDSDDGVTYYGVLASAAVFGDHSASWFGDSGDLMALLRSFDLVPVLPVTKSVGQVIVTQPVSEAERVRQLIHLLDNSPTDAFPYAETIATLEHLLSVLVDHGL